MFQRIPAFQAPSWLIALVIAFGVILDVHRSLQKTPFPDQVNLSVGTQNTAATNRILQPTKQNKLFAKN